MLREREADAVPRGGEGDEEHAPDDPDGDGQHGEHLRGVLGGHGVEAGHDVVVEERDGDEDHDGDDGVHEVDEAQPVRCCGLRVDRSAAVDDPEPAARGEAVAHGALGVPEAVGEAEREAGDAAIAASIQAPKERILATNEWSESGMTEGNAD